jgi:hypothetical protein
MLGYSVHYSTVRQDLGALGSFSQIEFCHTSDNFVCYDLHCDVKLSFGTGP